MDPVERNARLCRERGIVLPTLEQQRDPTRVPEAVRRRLREVDPEEIHPLNLFRITWKNDPATGGFGGVNHLELPRSLTGVPARIVGLVGRHFPTGAHKVGAAYGCLAPRLVDGSFDPTRQAAAWPSTGNYCRGGAYVSRLLGCRPIAILPEEMSRERFEWLEAIGSEIIRTPGSEANVKEIYDACDALVAERGDEVVVFNQFAEFGNAMWHHEVTAAAAAELLDGMLEGEQRPFAWVSSTGSAGTIAAGTGLRRRWPAIRIVAGEALQVPTLLRNGYGAHRIEGIGDKHVPWIHDVRDTDVLVAIDDAGPMALLRLFNEEAGREALRAQGVPAEVVDRLDLLGISGIANLLAAVRVARHFECDADDVILTVFTDSAAMYRSRVDEMRAAEGPYTPERARLDIELHLRGGPRDVVAELGHWDRRRIHNLKYFTWVEQQGRDVRELEAQWRDHRRYWRERLAAGDALDARIRAFNERSGALARWG